MAKKTQEYVIELTSTPASGAKKTMWRGGRMFEIKKPQVIELTNEEVEVYENDKRFKVSLPGDTSEQDSNEEASGSEADSQGSDTEDEANDGSESQDSEDSDSDGSEADSGSSSEDSEESDDNDTEDQATVLVQENDRNALNALAKEAGVVEEVSEAETRFKSKLEVAQAIVEAQARNSDGGATS